MADLTPKPSPLQAIMDISPLSFAGGLVLGLTSSLHCAAMCGGVCAGILVMGEAGAGGARAQVLALAQAGRTLSYATLGAIVGAAGAGVVGLMPTAVALRLLQWANAVALIWIGLSTAGLLPNFVVADRVMSLLARGLVRAVPVGRGRQLGSIAAGLAWGLMPCAMLYGALLTAMLTGSATGGATVMLGFALGTLPAVAGAGAGVRALAATEAREPARIAIGLAIAGLGVGAAYLPPALIAALCLQ